MFEQLQNLNSISLNFNESSQTWINLALAIIMFGVALGTRIQTFKTVFKKPKSLLIGLISQWIILPAITFIIIFLCKDYISPMVALGMILVASCPGGNISNFMSHFAKGNTELSVSMTAVTTLTASIITPANFAFWGGLYYSIITTNSEVPILSIKFFPIFKQVLILLGLPILLGIIFTSRFPEIAKRAAKPFQYVSLIFFMFLVTLALSQNWSIFTDYLFYIFIIVLIHNFVALLTGFYSATIFKLPKLDRRSLTLEIGIQNSGLGLVLLFNPNIFPQEGIGGMLIITAWWGIWHILSGLIVSTFFRNYDKTKFP